MYSSWKLFYYYCSDQLFSVIEESFHLDIILIL